MGIGQLPRLYEMSKEGMREWSDKTMGRLELIFTSPRQFGLAEIAQFQATAGATGLVTIPTPVGDLLLQWGNDAIAGGQSTKLVTFPVTFPNAAFVAFAGGSGSNGFGYSVAGLSATSFTATAVNGGTADSFYWLAVGN